MKKKLLIVSLSAFFLVVNFIVVTAFQEQQTLRTQAAVTIAQAVPTTALTTPIISDPAPTQFTCLGSCPISPTEPPAINPESPTPCPDTQVNSQNTNDDVEAMHRKKKNKSVDSDGLLQILIKLLELLIQLLGGGTVSTPSDNPCDIKPTDAPVPTDAPEPTQAPVATQAPAVNPTTPVSAALCGKKTTPPASTQTVSCSGLTATQPTSNGYYESTNFGCNIGFPKDPVDNCIPACSGTPECAGLSGRQCEEKVIWYSANADQYGCNAKLKVTNPVNGKAVIVRALDRGPGCSIQKNRSVFDISQAAYKEIGVQKFVHVEKVPESTPLGPIPVCQQ